MLFQLCLNTQLYLPERQADVFSMKPCGPTVAALQAMWGSHTTNSDSCPQHGASIEATATASVSFLIFSTKLTPPLSCSN